MAQCPNAVVGFDFCKVAGSIGYFMDKFTGGDLLDYVINSTLDEKMIAPMSYRILVALNYMHSVGYAHRDVKLENVFLTSDDPAPETYLGDFGLSAWRNRDAGELFSDHVGSRPYCAPELLTGSPYDEQVDIWAFGVTAYVMFTRQMPFPDAFRMPDDFLYLVSTGDFDADRLVDCGASEVAVDFITSLIQVNPNDRLTSAQALEHPFYAQEGGMQEVTKQEVGAYDEAFAQSGEFDF
jgi:serine/threonine protein kinase